MHKQNYLKVFLLTLIILIVFSLHFIFNGDEFRSIGFSNFESALINTITTILFVFIIARIAYKNDSFMVISSKLIFNASPSHYEHEVLIINDSLEKMLTKIEELKTNNSVSIFYKKKNSILLVYKNHPTSIIDIVKANNKTKIRIYKKFLYQVKLAKPLTVDELKSSLSVG